MKRLILTVLLALISSSVGAQFLHRIQYEHATDCPNNVTGKNRAMCVDLDDGKLWRCEPSVGACDTAGEWKAVGGTGGAFSDASDPIVPNTTTKDLTLGDAIAGYAGKVEIGGDADQVQLGIQGHSAQTNFIVLIEDNAGLDIFTISNDGTISTAAVANPELVLQDSDSYDYPTTPADKNLRFYGNLTDGILTPGGDEDMDWWIASQVAGADTAWISADADDGPDGGDPILALNFPTEIDATTPAASGAIRLDNNEGVCWRNSTDDGNVCFGVNASEVAVVTNGTLDANTGDSATGFFDAGTIEAARGGTGLDSSGATGVVRVNSGAWSADAGPTHLTGVTTMDDGDFCQGNASSGFDCDVTTIPAVDGGTGQDSGSSTGIPVVNSGTWSFDADPVDLAGVTTVTDGSFCQGATANGFDCDITQANIPGTGHIDNTAEISADVVTTTNIDDASDTPVEGEIVAVSSTTTQVNYVPPQPICKTLFDSGNLADTDDITGLYRWGSPAIITEAWCEVGDGTNVQIDLVTSDGADNIASNCVCTTSGVSCSLTDTTMIDGEMVDLTIDSISGSVTRLTFCMEYRYDL